MVLVRVNVQCVKRMGSSNHQKSGLYGRQKHIRAHNTNHKFCISLFGDGQDCIYEKYAFGLDQAMKCKC